MAPPINTPELAAMVHRVLIASVAFAESGGLAKDTNSKKFLKKVMEAAKADSEEDERKKERGAYTMLVDDLTDVYKEYQKDKSLEKQYLEDAVVSLFWGSRLYKAMRKKNLKSVSSDTLDLDRATKFLGMLTPLYEVTRDDLDQAPNIKTFAAEMAQEVLPEGKGSASSYSDWKKTRHSHLVRLHFGEYVARDKVLQFVMQVLGYSKRSAQAAVEAARKE